MDVVYVKETRENFNQWIHIQRNYNEPTLKNWWMNILYMFSAKIKDFSYVSTIFNESVLSQTFSINQLPKGPIHKKSKLLYFGSEYVYFTFFHEKFKPIKRPFFLLFFRNFSFTASLHSFGSEFCKLPPTLLLRPKPMSCP